MQLPTAELAYAIAAEWAQQPDRLEPCGLPIMTLASTALLLRDDRGDMIDTLLEYLQNDTISKRAGDTEDPRLEELEQLHWDPIVDWFGQTFGEMKVSRGYEQVTQLPETLAAVEQAMNDMDDWTLVGLNAVATAAKSVSIGLAVTYRHISASEAIKAARLEEQYQISLWGSIANAHDFDENYAKVRIYSASTYLWSLGNFKQLPTTTQSHDDLFT